MLKELFVQSILAARWIYHKCRRKETESVSTPIAKVIYLDDHWHRSRTTYVQK